MGLLLKYKLQPEENAKTKMFLGPAPAATVLSECTAAQTCTIGECQLEGWRAQRTVVRNTFIHVSGKPVENSPRGGGVKKLHRASEDPSEELVMEPGGGSQRALRSRGQSEQGPGTQALRQAQSLLHRPSTPKTGEGHMATEGGGG